MPLICNTNLRWPFHNEDISYHCLFLQTTIFHCDGESWLPTWLHQEQLNFQLLDTPMKGIFLIRPFELERPTLNLSDIFRWQPTWKGQEGGSFCLLPACPHSQRQAHLSCCWVIPLMVLESTSLGLQHTLKASSSLGIPVGQWHQTGTAQRDV